MISLEEEKKTQYIYLDNTEELIIEEGNEHNKLNFYFGFVFKNNIAAISISHDRMSVVRDLSLFNSNLDLHLTMKDYLKMIKEKSKEEINEANLKDNIIKIFANIADTASKEDHQISTIVMLGDGNLGESGRLFIPTYLFDLKELLCQPGIFPHLTHVLSVLYSGEDKIKEAMQKKSEILLKTNPQEKELYFINKNDTTLLELVQHLFNQVKVQEEYQTNTSIAPEETQPFTLFQSHLTHEKAQHDIKKLKSKTQPNIPDIPSEYEEGKGPNIPRSKSHKD